ncbi:MAG TPA: Hsp20/alpha crystallin family protein [Rudaea sp.]|nr:Hsp20/alpha crystallin family protein [Rudaea sp.]
MANLTQWNPFKTLARFDPSSTFDELVRGLRPAWRDFEFSPGMRIDVSEDDNGYTVKAEIPGVEKNDIDVSIERNQVSISAEVKRNSSRKENEKELYAERYVGRVYRSFSLPSDLDDTKALARYDNGVLTLTLPKKTAGGGTKRIAVS